MLSVCFSNTACFLSFPDSLLGLQSRFLARIGPVNSPDKTSDLRTAICLRYEVIMVLYKAKFNCKQTITFARSIRNSISGLSAMFGCNYSVTSRLKIWERVSIDASDVIVFKSIRFRVSTLIRYVCVFICIHFQQRFQIDAFSANTLSVFERISVDGRPKRIEMYAFSNENALVWTGPYSV